MSIYKKILFAGTVPIVGIALWKVLSNTKTSNNYNTLLLINCIGWLLALRKSSVGLSKQIPTDCIVVKSTRNKRFRAPKCSW